MEWLTSAIRNLFGKNPRPQADHEIQIAQHAVFVHLELTKDRFGGDDEVRAIHILGDRLDSAIEAAGTGEFDGDDFGDWQSTLYMYGPDADALFSTIEPILRSSACTRGGFVIKRYGKASDPEVREVRIDL